MGRSGASSSRRRGRASASGLSATSSTPSDTAPRAQDLDPGRRMAETGTMRQAKQSVRRGAS
jgi:hypothetical protein